MASPTFSFAFSSPLFIFLAFSVHAFTKADQSRFVCPTAVFSFADSLSDSGNRNLEGYNQSLSGYLPYGIALKRPNGRYCDGYLIPDFLVQYLGLGDELLPSLAYNGSYFRGLNFAYAGATVITVENNAYASPHNLSSQVQDFLAHQSRMERQFPYITQAWFENALYYVQIGGDDINFHVREFGFEGVLNVTVPVVIDRFRTSLLSLYAAGARKILLFNMPRADCSPFYLQTYSRIDISLNYDSFGCLADLGETIRRFNSELRQLAEELTRNYTALTVYYFDWFAANTEVLTSMEAYGFGEWNKACCGSGPGGFNCGGGGLCGCGNGELGLNYTVCENPDGYITFDGIHYGQHFYRVMADFLMRGEYVTPSVTFVPGCRIPLPDAPEPGS